MHPRFRGDDRGVCPDAAFVDINGGEAGERCGRVLTVPPRRRVLDSTIRHEPDARRRRHLVLIS